MKNSLKIFLITIIGISILFSGFSFSRPKFYPIEAKAGLPVSDILGAAIEQIWKVAQKASVAFIKQRILKVLVDQTIAWIQGDKNAFVKSWREFGLKALKQGIGDAILDDPKLSFLCSPFRAQLSLTLPLVPIPKFSEEVRCTLDDIGVNIKEFGKSFEAGVKGGSWIGFHNVWEPQNNFLGAQIIGQFKIVSEQEGRKESELLRAVAGGGYLGQEKAGKITTPGATVGKYVGKALESDFDFITNAEVEEIAGALVNAIFNRLMKEGAKGLAEITGLDKEEINERRKRIDADFERITKTDLQTIYLEYSTKINDVLTPREEVDVIIKRTTKDINDFLATDLEAKCYGDEDKIAAANEVIQGTYVDQFIGKLKKDEEENNVYLNPLATAKLEIDGINAGQIGDVRLVNADGNPLTNTDKIALMGEKFTNLENKAREEGIKDTILNESFAQEFLASAKEDQQNVTKTIKEVNKEIDKLCPPAT